MDLEAIKDEFRDHENELLGVDEEYSVLLPLVELKNGLGILYELRSENLETQPGEISFPGGQIEGAETPEEAALRETNEELRIEKPDINIIGDLNYLVSPYNVIIYSFLGFLDIESVERINYNNDEVEDIFTVPLDYFLRNQPDTFKKGIKIDLDDNFPYHLIPNGKDYDFREGEYPIYFYKYRDYTIWGFTARITRHFIQTIKE